MARKPTYEELKQRVIELEKETAKRIRAEKALRKEEQEKEAILDSLTEHIVYHDTEHKVLWANRAAGESVDLAPEKLVGRYCYEIWQKRTKGICIFGFRAGRKNILCLISSWLSQYRSRFAFEILYILVLRQSIHFS